MMAAQMGGSTTGHGCWPPTLIAEGAATVMAEFKPCTFMGADCIPHVCVAPPFPSHPAAIAEGSTTVFIEGKPAARMGDMLTCTDMIAMGADTVLKGG